MVGCTLLRRQVQFPSIQRISCTRHSSSFTPRSTFSLPPTNPFTWFPGHMLAGLRALSSTITDIDLIIETRDARIPLSSRNPYLEDVCAHKHRLVLYNKRDLAGLTSLEEQVGPHKVGIDSRELLDGIVGLVMRLCLLIFGSQVIFYG
jgi:hypothetical protein